MSRQNPPVFSALRVADSLSPQQLEFLTEFSDDVASLRFLSRSLPSAQQPTLAQALEIVEAAPVVLKKKKRKQKTTFIDKAWHKELAGEFLKPSDKTGERLPAVLSRPEIQELLDAAKPQPREHLLFRTFYASAMRISEVAAILIADLYLDELKIFVRDGKGDKDRYVLIDPETAQLLKEFTKDRPLDDKVFGIGERQIARMVEEYAEKLGITERYEAIGRRFTPHSFRHTCATHLYENGMDIYIIKDLLGHASIAVTREYIHIGINRQRDDYTSFHPLCLKTKEEDPETVRS